MKTESRASYRRLERRELGILKAKIHAMKTIGDECVDWLSVFLNTQHDADTALDAFISHVSLFKVAWQDYCDQKARVDEMVRLQQVSTE